MPVLYGLGVLILLIVLLFSIRIHLVIDYDRDLFVRASYLFLGYTLYPKEKGKPKKAKKEEPKKEKEKKKEDKPKEKKPKKESILTRFYRNKGVSGIIELLQGALHGVNGLLGRLWRQIVIHELFVDLVISGSDAADCALKYGKVCAAVYPTLGELCTHMRVRRYDATVVPDFLANRDSAKFYCELSVKPISITNAVVVLAGQLLFGVLIKLYKGSKTPKPQKSKQTTAMK